MRQSMSQLLDISGGLSVIFWIKQRETLSLLDLARPELIHLYDKKRLRSKISNLVIPTYLN